MAKKKDNNTENGSQSSSEISEFPVSSAAEAESAKENLSEQVEKTENLESSENELTADKVEASSSSQIFREQTLDFASIPSELTIEEVQEEAQILEEENLSAESPLDRYVRKHREEVENVKNALGSETLTPDEDDNDANDNEVESQNPLQSESLDSVTDDGTSESEAAADEVEAQEGELVDTTIFPAPTLSEIYESQVAEEKKFDSVELAASEPDAEEVPLPSRNADPLSATPKRSERVSAANKVYPSIPATANEAVPDSDSSFASEKEKKSAKKPIILGIVAIAAIGIATYAGIQIYNSNQTATKTVSSKAASKISTFNKDYETFFTDSSHKALKNSNFDRISTLGDDLNAIPTSDSKFTALQTKYNNLSSDISAVKSVNALFDKPVIVDGNFDGTAAVKTGVNIPNVSSKNETLNALLQKAVDLAKNGQTIASSSAAIASAQSAASSAASAAESSAAAADSAAASSASTTESSAAVTDNTAAAGSVYSQNPTGAAPDNAGSRVPVQSIDPSSAAFQWAPGVLDLTISTMQSRGYISGSDYILTPVAVDTAGEGWYNIYRPDGSYLFSINCKTGFWAGAGGKYPNLPASF
ncbi:cell division site-positioning protein MapZ family protein [Lactovum odontotermitis]